MWVLLQSTFLFPVDYINFFAEIKGIQILVSITDEGQMLCFPRIVELKNFKVAKNLRIDKAMTRDLIYLNCLFRFDLLIRLELVIFLQSLPVKLHARIFFVIGKCLLFMQEKLLLFMQGKYMKCT